MKRYSMAIAWLLYLCLVLTGCGTVPTLPDGSAGTPAPAPTSSPTPIAPTPAPTPKRAERSALLAHRQPMDDAGALSYIPNEVTESGLMQKLLLTEQGLLLYGSALGEEGEPVFLLRLLSTETGQVVQSTSFTGLELPEVQLVDDGVAVTDWADGRVLLLDSELRLREEYDAEAENCGIYVDPGCSQAFTLDKTGGIRVTDMSRGETSVLLDNAVSLLAAGRCSTAVTVTYTDKNTQLQNYAVLDLETATVAAAPFEGAFSSVTRSGELWLAELMGGEDIYYLGRGSSPKSFSLPSMVVELTPEGRLLTFAHGIDGTAAQLYDADGAFRSACRLPVGTGFFGDPVWSERDGGYWLTAIDPSGKDLLLFWDLSIPVAGQDLLLTAAQKEENDQGQAVSAALYERAASLDQYGVSVKIADLAQTEFLEHTTQPETEEAYITAALDTVEQVLSAYPAGFFTQLHHGTVRNIELHLTGCIQVPDAEGTSGFTSFVGFVETAEGSAYIVLDITAPGSLSQTLHHEIFHLIDNRLSFDAKIRPEALYSEDGWSALNPEGFAYANRYQDLPMEFYISGNDAWFTELYSRTFAREDRATVFEYAAEGTEWIFSGAAPRLRKLEYLCRCIRDCFDTADWPAATFWESCCLRAGGTL